MCARKISESADYPMVENVLDEKLLTRSKPTEERPQVTNEILAVEKSKIAPIENRKLPEIPVLRNGRSRERLNYPRNYSTSTLRAKVSRRRCRSNDVQSLRKDFKLMLISCSLIGLNCTLKMLYSDWWRASWCNHQFDIS